MTTGASALGAVAVGIYSALKVASFSGAAGVSPGGVYDDIPQGEPSAYPYTTYTLRESDGGGATFGKGGKELTLRLRGWDTYQGYKQLHALVNKAAELLHHTLPSLSGHTSLLVIYEGAIPLPTTRVNEVDVRGLEAVFRILTEQN